MKYSWDSAPHPSANYWGTGNVEEVVPGVTRPLAADLIMAETYAWAAGMVDAIGIRDQIDLAPLPAGNIFGFFGGRCAVNIAWLGTVVATYQPEQQSQMLAQYLRGDDEGMKSGVAENVARAKKTRTRVERLWRLAPERAEKEVAVSERARAKSLDQRRLARESEAQLLARVDATVALCGRLFVRHSQTTMGGGEHLGLLGNFLDRAIPGHPPEWSTTLTSALGDVSSAEPVHAIWELAQTARRQKRVADDIRSLSETELAERIATPPGPAWEQFASAFRAFIAQYGFRGQAELDASVPDWSEDATFVLSAVRTNLSVAAARNPKKREEQAVRARAMLEESIERRLGDEQRAEFRRLLGPTQTLVRARELTKANLARASRAYRPPLLALGRRFAANAIIAAPDDVFFLRLKEIREAVTGKLTARRAKAAVAARRAEHERLQGFELPVVFTLPVEPQPVRHEQAARHVRLEGIAVSAGVASGRARVILSAEAGERAELEEGEILVAPLTDAAWTPLFWPAAAVVVERGGILSHASTVAREFGIPAVVGVPHATEIIPPGAMVTVDGNAGVVTVEG